MAGAAAHREGGRGLCTTFRAWTDTREEFTKRQYHWSVNKGSAERGPKLTYSEIRTGGEVG